MMHELYRRLPALVLEKNDCPIAVLCEVEADLCAEPFFRPVDHLPENTFARFKLENLHVEAAVTETKLQLAADLAFAPRVARPPARQAFDRGQCVIDSA